MHVGLIPAFDGGVVASGGYLTQVVAATERNGFDSVWVGEHIALPVHPDLDYPGVQGGLQAPSDAPLPDPLDWLAFASAVTDTLLIGTAVVLANLHHPLVLAKRAATIDRLSGGRLRLGVGIGWNAQEYRALGVAFEHRALRLEEYITAMRTAWRDTAAEFSGEFVTFEPVYSSPKPATGSIPILIGGNSVAAARRAGRLGDGYFPFERDTDRLAVLMAEVRQAAESAGRDPDCIEITSLGSPRAERVDGLAELGVHRMVVFVGGTSPDAVDEIGDRCRATVSGMRSRTQS